MKNINMIISSGLFNNFSSKYKSDPYDSIYNYTENRRSIVYFATFHPIYKKLKDFKYDL